MLFQILSRFKCDRGMFRLLLLRPYWNQLVERIPFTGYRVHRLFCTSTHRIVTMYNILPDSWLFQIFYTIKRKKKKWKRWLAIKINYWVILNICISKVLITITMPIPTDLYKVQLTFQIYWFIVAEEPMCQLQY